MSLPEYEDTILIQASKLSPEKAIAFFREKEFKITWNWRETLNDANNATFQVAKSMNMGVLQDIRGMVDKALKDGIGFRQFAKDLEPMLIKRGWWGSQVIGGQRVQLGSMHRLKTIYATNTQSAYNAGRWKVQERGKKRRPFLRLNEVLDTVTRDSHRKVSGTVAPVDDPFWDRWYPPNGFRCRGRVQPITAERAKGGKKPIKDDPDKGFSNNPGKKVFKPKKGDFDSDLEREAKKMNP